MDTMGIKVLVDKVALSPEEQKELVELGYKIFDHLQKEGIIHKLECPTFSMAWSMACLHFDKKLGERLKRLAKEEKVKTGL